MQQQGKRMNIFEKREAFMIYIEREFAKIHDLETVLLLKPLSVK